MTPKQKLIKAVSGQKAHISTIYETDSNYHLFERNRIIDSILNKIKEILPE